MDANTLVAIEAAQSEAAEPLDNLDEYSDHVALIAAGRTWAHLTGINQAREVRNELG